MGMLPAHQRFSTSDTPRGIDLGLVNQQELVLGYGLAQFGFEPIPAIKDVPMGLAFVKDPADLEAIRLIFLQQETGRPIVAPPGIPTERLSILRRAFDATMKDPAFLEEAAKAQLDISPLSGAAIEDMLTKAYATQPQIVERAKVILARASGEKKD